MRIGYLLSSFYPETGGREIITFHQARELARRGHEVHIFTSLKKGLKKEEEVEGLHIHRTRTWFKYKYYLDFNPGWIKNILKYKLDILHVQSFGFVVADAALLLKKLLSKTKFVNTPHGPFMALESYPLWQASLKKLYTTMEKPVNRLYDAVVQVNPGQWRWMTKLGVKKDRIHFIPNSIPEEMFEKVKNHKFVRKHSLKDKLVISYLGRIQKYKGIDQVITVLPELVICNPKIRFLVMGKDAGDLKRLKALAKKLGVSRYVIFTGVNDEEKLQGLDVSQIFILPSEWEAFGIVIIEAMARGNAIISTNTEGGKFLIEKSVNGYLYDYKDTEQLKLHLLKLIKYPKLRKIMINANKRKARQFSTEVIAWELEKLYKSLLEK